MGFQDLELTRLRNFEISTNIFQNYFFKFFMYTKILTSFLNCFCLNYGSRLQIFSKLNFFSEFFRLNYSRRQIFFQNYFLNFFGSLSWGYGIWGFGDYLIWEFRDLEIFEMIRFGTIFFGNFEGKNYSTIFFDLIRVGDKYFSKLFFDFLEVWFGDYVIWGFWDLYFKNIHF